MNWIELLGICGVLMINVAYFLLNLGKMHVEGWAYPLINFVGASLIVGSLLIEWNLSAFLMESSWAAISLYGFIKAFQRKNAI